MGFREELSRGVSKKSRMADLLLSRDLFRASIEEDYAKRLSKLAKVPVGKDEMG